MKEVPAVVSRVQSRTHELIRTVTKDEETEWEWLHRPEVGFRYNSQALADELIDAGGFQERPSEYESQAKKGVKQYRVRKQILRETVSQMESTLARVIQDHMRSSFSGEQPPNKKARTGAPKEKAALSVAVE